MSKKYSQAYIDKLLADFEKYSEEVEKRYSYIKSRLSNRYDKTDTIYNKSKDTLMVARSVHLTKIKRGIIDKSTREWMEETKYYATTPVRLIVSDKVEDRKQEFYSRLKEINVSEYNRARYLFNKMSEEDKEEFFTSDFFFINTKPDSLGYQQFLIDNNRSVEVAKLEDYMKSKGYNIKSTFDKKVGDDDEEN